MVNQLLEIRYDLVGEALERLSDITIPKEPPRPPVKIIHGDPNKIWLPVHLATDLEWYTVLLAELAVEKRGGYESGHEVPADCAAISVSTILTATSTLEAYVNETITIHAKHNRRKGSLDLFIPGFMEQSILTRLESLFIALGIGKIDWGKQPYQSLKLLFMVRNALVHHEGKDDVVAAEGYYPKKAFKALIGHIKSPYKDDDLSPYHWYTHISTPNGAIWATNVMLEIVDIINNELDSEN